MFFNKPNFLRKKITSKEIHEIFKATGHIRHGVTWSVFDTSFHLATEDEITAVIEADKTDQRLYTPLDGDCDNFAFELRAAFGRKGWAVGVVIVDPDDNSVNHALFFYIDDQKNLVIVEPQTDNKYKDDFKAIQVIMY